MDQVAVAQDASVLTIGNEFAVLEVIFFWIASFALFEVLDLYAARKMGGKTTDGFKALRMRKFVSLIIVSIVSVFAGGYFIRGGEVAITTMTFLGVPYLAMWFFYMVSVLRRVKAEKSRPQDPGAPREAKKKVIKRL